MPQRPLVKDRDEIVANVRCLVSALADERKADFAVATELIRLGHNFVVVRDGTGSLWFTPSKFAGYRDNRVGTHRGLGNGGRTDVKLSSLLARGASPEPMTARMRDAYVEFCGRLGIEPTKRAWTFWPEIDVDTEWRVLTSGTTKPERLMRPANSPGPSPAERRPASWSGESRAVHQIVQRTLSKATHDAGWLISEISAEHGVLPDLAVERGERRIVFEVKSSGTKADVYEGVGQLLVYRQLFWSECEPELVLVITNANYIEAEWLRAFKTLGVKLLRFRLAGKTPTFPALDQLLA